jgi:formylglycine-generating enzyme required for sulfatase activity
MKMRQILQTVLILGLASVFPATGRAQGDITSTESVNPVSSDVQTNPPSLKDLMTTNNVMTNTVGIVLVKNSSTLWAGRYEVTQESYEKVMGGNPSVFKGANNPVDSVNWNDATAFCEKLTKLEQKSDDLPKGFIYSLPTQDQWKMLAGNTSLEDAVMSLNMHYRTSTEPVGGLKPNNVGLYDTRGNVMEWCLDPQDKPYRVLRGGAWDTYIEINSRLEFREYSSPDKTKNDYGFRVVLEKNQ